MGKPPVVPDRDGCRGSSGGCSTVGWLAGLLREANKKKKKGQENKNHPLAPGCSPDVPFHLHFSSLFFFRRVCVERVVTLHIQPLLKLLFILLVSPPGTPFQVVAKSPSCFVWYRPSHSDIASLRLLHCPLNHWHFPSLILCTFYGNLLRFSHIHYSSWSSHFSDGKDTHNSASHLI